MLMTQASPIIVAGERQWVEYRELDGDTDDFECVGHDFEATGGVRIGQVAAGRARLMSIYSPYVCLLLSREN